MLIIWWVFGVVCVNQHGSCSTWNKPDSSKLRVNESPFCVVTFSRKESRGGGSSPCCASSEQKSIEFPFSRQGVPVLKRPVSNPRARMLSLRLEALSAIRPPGLDCSPTCSSPRRNVPAVITTDFAGISMPKSVVTPRTLPLRTTIVAAVPCNNRRFGVFSRIAFSRN